MCHLRGRSVSKKQLEIKYQNSNKTRPHSPTSIKTGLLQPKLRAFMPSMSERTLKAKVNFALVLNTKTQSSRGIELRSFFNLGARRGWLANATPRPLYPRGRDPVLIVHGAGWAPGPVWTNAENLAPHRDSIPRPSSP